MAQMTDGCYHVVANDTLEDQRVIDLMLKMNPQIFESMPETVIPDMTKQRIRLPINTPDMAVGLIRTALKDSLQPNKMAIFIQKLTENQPIHGERLKEVYNEKLTSHPFCPHCPPNLPDIPDGEPGDRVGEF